MPLSGVLLFDWNLGEIMVLFWSESAVIGFYNVVKLAVVARWGAVFVVPFFAGHLCGFMAAHFTFVYYLFVKGMAGAPDLPVFEALSALFHPLRFAIAALVLSHGVSLVVNFFGRREYAEQPARQLMGAPYQRIFIMQLNAADGDLRRVAHAALRERDAGAATAGRTQDRRRPRCAPREHARRAA